MFQTNKKEERDGHISRFDPNSPPTASIYFSRDSAAEPTIRLLRKLTDDTGEWDENGILTKQKGKALEKVQESLPISADAATLLLWGLQEDLAAVIDNFPSDGHSLLTAATIKGSGPDPKLVIEDLEEQRQRAKAKGKNPGTLTLTENSVSALENELEIAKEADRKLSSLRHQFDKTKNDYEEIKRRHGLIQNDVKQLAVLAKLSDAVMDRTKEFAQLESRLNQGASLDEQINTEKHSLKLLGEEMEDLEAQHRVVKYKELNNRIESLKGQIKRVKAAEKKTEDLKANLLARKRPEKTDETRLRELIKETEKAKDKIEASGVRYEISVESGSKTIRLSEDSTAAKEVRVTGGKTHKGVVGNFVLNYDGLNIMASGKEDIASLKSLIEGRTSDISKLFKRFAVENDDEFYDLVEERKQLEEDLKEAGRELEKELKGLTLSSLESDLEQAKRELQEIKVTQKDLKAYADKHLGVSADLERKLAQKQGEVTKTNKTLSQLLEKKPTEEETVELKSSVAAARKKLTETSSTFRETDESHRECSSELRDEIKSTLEKKRRELEKSTSDKSETENHFTQLRTSLKYSGPERPVTSVEADLDEAKTLFHREEVYQRARALLLQRLSDKISEMAANVPREIGERISQHIATLTKGSYSKVGLTDKLDVDSIGEGRESAQQWKPSELSHGERHITALAIKLAVAQALAELSGPVFIILDDSLVALDPGHRTATENLLLELTTYGNLQIILLTCHTDWATDWKSRAGNKINFVELAKIATYYRKPSTITSV